MPLFVPPAGGPAPITILPQTSAHMGGYVAIPPIMPAGGFPLAAAAPQHVRHDAAHAFVPTTSQPAPAAVALPAPTRAPQQSAAPSSAGETLLSFDSPTSLMVESLLSAETDAAWQGTHPHVLGLVWRLARAHQQNADDERRARTDFDDDGMDIAEGQLDPDDVFRSYLGQ
jgi:hypothetical protein